MREIDESSGAGGSKMPDVPMNDEMEIDECRKKENEDREEDIPQTEDIKSDAIEEGPIEEEILPLKKQKLDFYKNLEAIENNST